MAENVFESSVIKHLLNSQSYFQKAASSIKNEFFDDATCKEVFIEFNKFIQQNVRPSETDILISLSKTLQKDKYLEVSTFLKNLKKTEISKNIDWLLKETESWLKVQSFKYAVSQNIDLMGNNNLTQDQRFAKGIEFMKDALRVGFTKVQSLDFFDIVDNNKFDNVFDQYKFLQTGFKPIDEVFMGGFAKSALYVIMASTGVGKTLAMIFLAFEMMKQGHNVIYFSHEISKNALLVRVLSNLLSMKTVDIVNLRKNDPEEFNEKLREAIGGLSRKGSLKIESFPNGQCSASSLKTYLDEMKVNFDWKPDAVFSDYLNIMVSSRMSASTASRHYYVQSIAEECRELASEYEIPFITATQTNRDGIRAGGSTDLTHMSESLGAAITADGVISLSDLKYEEEMIKEISSEISHVYGGELLKTRFGGNTGQKIVIGVNKDYQRFSEISSLLVLPQEERAGYLENEKKKKFQNYKKEESPVVKKQEVKQDAKITIESTSVVEEMCEIDEDFNL